MKNSLIRLVQILYFTHEQIIHIQSNRDAIYDKTSITNELPDLQPKIKVGKVKEREKPTMKFVPTRVYRKTTARVARLAFSRPKITNLASLAK